MMKMNFILNYCIIESTTNFFIIFKHIKNYFRYKVTQNLKQNSNLYFILLFRGLMNLVYMG